MAGDYIPAVEGEFDTFSDNYVLEAAENAGDLGLSPADVSRLQGAQITYKNAQTDRNTAQSTLNAAVSTLKTARDAFTDVIRDLTGNIQRRPETTDAERRLLRITVPKEGRTPAPVATTYPILTASPSGRLRHDIEFRDSATPNSKAKPEGMTGCEIYCVLLPASAPPPIDQSTMKFLGLDTRAPYLHAFEAQEIGMTAHYIACWVNTRGERGPFGPITSATVTG